MLLRKEMLEYITDDIEISSNDSEILIEEILMKKFLMKKILIKNFFFFGYLKCKKVIIFKAIQGIHKILV